jgi:hypothetical protein
MTNATMIANNEVVELLAEIKRVRAYKESVAEQEKYLVQRLYNIVNEHDRFITVDEHGIEKEVATWKYAKDTERFDAKKFKEFDSALYADFVKITPGARTLRISK